MKRDARLIICEDHHLVAAGLVKLLDDHYAEVAVVHSATELLAALLTRASDGLLLDLALPDRAGLTLIPEIRRLQPDLKILIVTMYADPGIAGACMAAGALGFVPKSAEPAELFAAIESVLMGGKFISPSLSRKTHRLGPAAERLGWERLTPRQQEIIRKLGLGQAQKEIADDLGLSRPTIAFHVKNIKRILGTAQTRDLVRLAILHAPAEPPPIGPADIR